MKIFKEPSREIPISEETDVLVVGGGSAGLSAAIAASRKGCSVTLIESSGFLGGTLTTVTLGSFCGIFTVTENEINYIVKGFQEELIERLKLHDGVLPPKRWLKTASVPYDVTCVKKVADELITEAGVQIYYHTNAVSIIKEENEIKGVVIQSKEGRSVIKSKVVIDSSGDGDIFSMCDEPHELGNNGVTQSPTAMFRLANVDVDEISTLTRHDYQGYLQKAAEDGYPIPRLSSGIFITPLYGVVHLNVTKIAHENGKQINPLQTKDLTIAEIEGRKQAFLYEEIFRRYIPGYAKARIVDIGSRIGIRESRLIKGEYILKQDDVLSCRKFNDVIACSAWPLEMHGEDNQTKWVWLDPGDYYTIPYRSLLPKNTDNLLVAGRNLSATHEAQASARVSATCMAMGQAAGIAAYLALNEKNKVRDISVENLQFLLTKDNAFLGSTKPEKAIEG